MDSKLLLQVLVLVATVQAGLAVVQYAARLAGSAAWLPAGLGGLTGTYVSKNGSGNLVAMALPVTAAALVERILAWGGERESGGAGRRLAAALAGRGRIAGPALALTVQVLGLALTMSRGAMAAGAAGLGIVLLAGALRWRGRAAVVAAAGVPVIFALLIGAWLGLDLLLASWAKLPDQHADRVDWWVAAWAAFQASPAAGTGLGSFADAFLVHRTGAQPTMHVAHAHNDYAEALAVMGIPGGVLIVLALGLLAAGIVRSVRRGGWATLGAGAGCAAFALHAIVDFPTAYSANAMWVVALWALAAADLYRRSPEGARVGADSVGDGTPGIGHGLPRRLVRRSRGEGGSAGGAKEGVASHTRDIGHGVASHTGRRIAMAAAAAAAAAPTVLHAIHDPGMDAVRLACREVRRSGTLPAGVAETWKVERESFDRKAKPAADPTPAARRPEKEPPADGVTVEDLVARAEAAAAGWSFASGEAWRALGTLQRFRAGRLDEAERRVLGDAERAHARRRSLVAFADALRIRPALGEAWLEYAGALVDDAEEGGAASSIDAIRRADRAAGRAGRLAPAAIRVAVREAELRLRMARLQAGGAMPGIGADEAAAWRKEAQAAYGRALGLGPVGGLTALHLRDAWQRGGSTGFMLGCIPAGGGDRTGALYRQAAALVASAAPVTEADAVLLAWRRWREKAGHGVASHTRVGADSVGDGTPEIGHGLPRRLVRRSPGEGGSAGGAKEGVASHARTVVLRIAGRVFGTGVEETFAFEAGGAVELSIDGLTRYRQPAGMAGNWAYNPCARVEARIDGAVAAEAFLPLDAEMAAREGRPWAGMAAPPVRVRLRLGPGAHRLTLRFESMEDVTGLGRPSGLQEAEIREMTVSVER